jgi:hypothetical protein
MQTHLLQHICQHVVPTIDPFLSEYTQELLVNPCNACLEILARDPLFELWDDEVPANFSSEWSDYREGDREHRV